MIVCLQGNQGKGKTATLAWLAWHYHQLGHKIHSNFWLEIKGLEPHYITNLNDIEHIYGGYFMADEFWSWVDSHKSFGDVEETVVSIIMNLRKRGYSLIYEAKRAHFMNRRIRELTDYVLEPQIMYNNNGSLEVIQQNLLYPIDLTPYLNDLWVVVKQYEVIGEKLREMPEEEIMFKLSDVIHTYNTKEEILSLRDGETHAGIEKGILKENHLIKAIREICPGTGILHNHNSLGWDVRTDNMAFDSVSVQMRNTSTRPYIDIRGKKIKELLKNAKAENRAPYWAWCFKGEWFCLGMTEEHTARKILNTRDAVNLKTVLTLC